MQLTAAILAFATGAIAVPAATSAATGPVATSSVSQPFNVLSIRSGTTLQYSPWGATKGSLLSGLKEQGAKCDKSDGNSATFEIRDGELFLYNKDKDTQKVWVDLSGMGQGVIGYTSTNQSPLPKSAETKGFSMDQNSNLKFAGKDFIACPSFDKSWAIWSAAAGVSKPGYQDGCQGIAAMTSVAKDPNSCTYTN